MACTTITLDALTRTRLRRIASDRGVSIVPRKVLAWTEFQQDPTRFAFGGE